MNVNKEYTYLAVAKMALEHGAGLLRDFMLDGPADDVGDAWMFCHGGVFACLDLAHSYLDEFTEAIAPGMNIKKEMDNDAKTQG